MHRRSLARHNDVVRLQTDRDVRQRGRQNRRQLLRFRFRLSLFHFVLRAVLVSDHKSVRRRHHGQLRLSDQGLVDTGTASFGRVHTAVERVRSRRQRQDQASGRGHAVEEDFASAGIR